MQVENIDQIISVTATNYLNQHCACKRSLRTDTKLSFRAFRVESHTPRSRSTRVIPDRSPKFGVVDH